MVKPDWWSNLTINNESKSKVLQYSLAVTWNVAIAGLTSSSSGTPLVTIPRERVSIASF